MRQAWAVAEPMRVAVNVHGSTMQPYCVSDVSNCAQNHYLTFFVSEDCNVYEHSRY